MCYYMRNITSKQVSKSLSRHDRHYHYHYRQSLRGSNVRNVQRDILDASRRNTHRTSKSSILVRLLLMLFNVNNKIFNC